MAFQDFDYLSERRKAEKSKRLKKRIAVAAMSTLILGVVIAVAVLCIIHTSDKNASDGKTTSSKASPDEAAESTEDASSGSSKDASSGSSKDAPSDSSKDAPSDSSNNATEAAAAALKTADLAAKTLCAATDFEDACNKAMGKAEKNESSDNKTNNVVKVAIKANTDEVKTSFGKVESLNFQSKEEKDAFEDCKELLQDAMDELSSATTEATGDITKIPSKSGDLNNWLSAVMSYQQTCIDGFPDGKLKTELEKTLKTAKELTSNSLAITTKVSSFGKDENKDEAKAGSRRLLSKGSPNHPVNDLDKDGFPRWLLEGDRRMLKNNKEDMPTPNVTVAKDGSGKFKTINEALSAMPKTYKDRYVIYVKAGIYDETVIITKKMVNVTLFGDGSQKSVITGKKNFVDGVRTFQTASFAALGEGFIARAMGFRNTAGPEKHQAVAARVQADKAIFLNCRFEGYQDTLYAQTHRQYYRACVIIGTIDFIFGDAAAVFQNCEIIVRKPLDNQQNIVTAQGRVDKRETTGIVIQNCRIEADPTLVPVKAKIKSYLGRPWKEYSRTVIMESTIDDLIQPEGWLPWEGEFALKTLYYAEYNNKGAGASLTSRVSWAGYQKKFKRADAQKFAIGTFLESEWIKEAKIPVKVGLYY